MRQPSALEHVFYRCFIKCIRRCLLVLQLMQQYIPGFTGKPVSYRNYHAYQSTDRLYVIIPARTDQDSYYELAAITVYMQEAGFPRLAQPMLTTDGQILTVYENTAYLVVEMPPPYSR